MAKRGLSQIVTGKWDHLKSDRNRGPSHEQRTEQVNLVNNEHCDVLHVVPGLPTPTDAVPFLRGCHYQGRRTDGTHVRSDIPGQLNNSVNGQ